MVGQRYTETLARLAQQKSGAFVPFTVLGDPDVQTSLQIVRTLIDAGADILELGLPFSDPIADGPTIQSADVRALKAGVRIEDAWRIIETIRKEYETIPIGLLIYGNLVESNGRETFYRRAAAAGVDSVLVADVPTLEAAPFAEVAVSCGIAPVLIATPMVNDEQIAAIAALSKGYTYAVTRAGVTGVDEDAQLDHSAFVARLKAAGAPPAIFGFGISKPEHVQQALAAGAAGAISGSAVVSIIERHAQGDHEAMLSELANFVSQMKRATVSSSQ